MVITPEEKRALRRVGADRMLCQKDLAKLLGIQRQTVARILNNTEKQEVNRTTYQKIAKLIASNY